MRIAVLVNDFAQLEAKQTTTLLLERLLSRRHEVMVIGVGDWLVDAEDRLVPPARRLPTGLLGPDELVACLQEAPAEPIDVSSLDLLLVRTNPARDQERATVHLAAQQMCSELAARGVPVLNEPPALARAATKISLLDVPRRYRPATIVTRECAALERFAASLDGPVVLKPLQGTRGQNVFVLQPGDRWNLRQAMALIARSGYAMAQAFVPEVRRGDVRVLLLEGRPLEAGGVVAAMRRRGRAGEFRANLSLGGKAILEQPSPQVLAQMTEIGQLLVGKGYFLVGVDLVGDQVIEINGHSPGGLRTIGRMAKRDFAEVIIEALERRVTGT
jgi:glutathione synthase